MSTEEILFEVEEKMEKAVAHLRKGLATVRTGRATPGLVEGVRVVAYGCETPLKQLATIACPEPQQILIRPFDVGTLKDIEKGILASNVGYAPNNDGKVIRLNIPPLSTEVRRKMATMIRDLCEECKIAIRNVRRDGNKAVDAEEKAKTISEDEQNSVQVNLQSVVAEVDPPQGDIPKKELSNKEVTDHTASLWKYLPVPVNEPDPAPEYKISNAVYPGAAVIGARVRGKKHKHEGSNCDDWFESSCYEDVTFAAVSDGAGSKKFSRVGARESCRAAIGYLINEYPKLLETIPTLRDDLKLPLTDEKCVSACGSIAGLVQQSVLQARKAVEAAFYSRSTDSAYTDLLHRKLALEDLSGTLLVSAILF